VTAAGHNGSHLPQLLRDLVARQGSGVMETAEGFRAALDDFLSEDEATTGELNLLVDAVRLGAVNRLLLLLDHGGDPAAAIAEAGDAMARDRGTDDSTRSRWAVAALAYALGRLGGDDVPVEPAGTLTPPGPPSQPPPPAPRPPTPAPDGPRTPTTDAVDRPGPRTLGDREPQQSTWDHLTAPPPTRRRRVWPAVAAVVVLLMVAGGALGWVLLDNDEEPDSPARDGGSSVDPSIDLPVELGSETILVAAKEGPSSRIYQVDADTGAVEDLTSGPSDYFPTVSRDREQVAFVVHEGRSVRPMVLDLDTREIRPLFGSDGACQYGRRPGWDLAGDRLAVPCETAEGEYTDIFVVDLEGREIAQVETAGPVRGSPTWVSEDELVYSQGRDSGDVPSTLWRVNIVTGEERQLTSGAEGWDSQPVWSGAQDRLLFTRSDSQKQRGELWTMDDLDVARQLAIDETVGGPAWSPGGGRIAFTVDGEDGPVLVTAPSDDPAAYTAVDDIPGVVGVPAWDTR
jgi:hypothetical protein